MESSQKQEPKTAQGNEGIRAKATFWQRRPVIIIGTGLLFGLLFYVLGSLAESLTHETTDDAFLDANIISIAPKVSGQIKQVRVKSNQSVKTGELLVEIDPRDLAVQREQKQAAFNAAKANLDLLKANFELRRTQIGTAEATGKQSTAEVAAAEANAERTRADLKRAEELIQNHTISPQEFDSAKAAATATQATLHAARERTLSDQSKVTEAKAQQETTRKALDWGEAQAHQAEADVEAAELNLSYANVKAPGDGYVTKKAVENGDYVQVGQKLMALVPNDLYVTANYKETQVGRIRPGQPVRITVDSVPGPTYRGHVDSIMAGSGARFSLLPPENAVGNYVKVVQRIPVKILFDEPVQAGHVLGPGMSAVPSVTVEGIALPQSLVVALAAALALITGIFWWAKASRSRSSA